MKRVTRRLGIGHNSFRLEVRININRHLTIRRGLLAIRWAVSSRGRFPPRLLPSSTLRSEGLLLPDSLSTLLPSLFGATSNFITLPLYLRTYGDHVRRTGVVSLAHVGLGSISLSPRHTPQRSGLAEVDARLISGVLSGDLVVNVEAIMGGSLPTFIPGKRVIVEKPSGGESSLLLIMPEKCYLCPSFIEGHTAKGVGLRVVNSHIGTYREDDFTPLETIRRAKTQDLLITISELKEKLKSFEKGKFVNLKFDKPLVLKKLICVTPFHKQSFRKEKFVPKTVEKNVLTKSVTSHNLPKKKKESLKNTNVISPGMYKVKAKYIQETHVQADENVSPFTGVKDVSSVDRQKSRRAKLKKSACQTLRVDAHSSLGRKLKPMYSEDSRGLNQEDNAELDENAFINPFSTSVSDEAESSSRNLDPSNIHTFYQPLIFEHQWTKVHSLEQILGVPSKPVMTRSKLSTDAKMCIYALTVSLVEPNNIKKAMADPS
ncbi:hypothetical protein Tco_1568350 [Tanacetum coccineum]